MHGALVIVFAGLLVFLAHFFAVLFNRTKVPDVLMLILVGFVCGPVLGLVTPGDFGQAGPILVTVTLVTILFEGGLDLRLDDLHKTLAGSLALGVYTFLGVAVVVGAASYLLDVRGILNVAVLGVILGASAPVVIIPLVRQLKMKPRSMTILTVESVISEVLCIVAALALMEAYIPEAPGVGITVGRVVSSFVVAVVVGVVSAAGWSKLLHRVRNLENSLFTTPAFVFIVFGLVEALGFSGPLAALTFGITLGNIGGVEIPSFRKQLSVEHMCINPTEKVFFSEAVFLLKTFFFFYMGVSIRFSDFWVFYVGLVLTFLIFLVRIPMVKLTMGDSVSGSEATVMTAMIPRGLASAAVASIPVHRGLPGAETIQEITYMVVLLSIALTSLMIFLLDKSVTLAGIYGSLRYGFRKPLKLMPEEPGAVDDKG